MRLFDAHCHLQDRALLDQIDGVLARARAAGVSRMICCATHPVDWDAVVEIATANPGVDAMLGIHPWFAGPGWESSLSRLETLLKGCPQLGVGETGLDFQDRFHNRGVQEDCFRAHLDLAGKYGRPVAIHCVRASGRLFDLLQPQPAPAVLLHAFSGPAELVPSLIRCNGWFSFGAALLQPRAVRVKKALAAVPLDRLLFESDSPDFTPPGCAPPNEPAYLVHTLRAASQIRRIDVDSLAETVYENTVRFFDIMPSAGCRLDKPTVFLQDGSKEKEEGSMKVFVTGGTGYIGSHTVVELLHAGADVIILDNLSNSSRAVLGRIERITGKTPSFIEGDIRDAALLRRIFSETAVDAVIHFAGLKAVGESVQKPLDYYEVNVGGSITLYQEMARAGIFRLVFSSSATVYGDPARVPIDEETPVGKISNPYGRSKRMNEEICMDVAASDRRWKIALLRYFNPVGAHPSGLIGEDPNGIPNNLVPYISQVAVGRLAELSVFGGDWPTADGTGVRDYIHVMDLAKGHLKALDKLDAIHGARVWNLGTGTGYSVREVIAAFEAAACRPVRWKVAPRREGDIAACWADPSRAWVELGWRAELDLAAMMRDTWRWQSMNPSGYAST